MKTNKPLKLLTLISFILLLSSFVAFKAGAFDIYFKSENTQHTGLNNFLFENPNTLKADSPIVVRKDSFRMSPSMLPTSKSAVFIDQRVKITIPDTIKADTTKKKPKK